MEPTITLTDEQVTFYRKNGFLAIDAITTPEEVARIREIYDDLFGRRAGRELGYQFDLAGTDEEGKEAALPQILNPAHFVPELAETLYRANALSISKQLLGDDAFYMGEHAIMKPAGHGAATPWHQDEAYFDPAMEYNALSVWMPLQDTSVEMGCMQFLPGSQKLDVVPHQSINNDPRVHGLEVAVPVDSDKAVACPLPAGGATFHASGTLHFTGANHTQNTRRAYILLFATEPKKRAVPRDFYWLKKRHTARDDRAAAAAAAGNPEALKKA